MHTCISAKVKKRNKLKLDLMVTFIINVSSSISEEAKIRNLSIDWLKNVDHTNRFSLKLHT